VQFRDRWFRWIPFARRSPAAQPTVVGVFGQPRGGTNFIAAALHYHPRIFSVTEHELDYRRPLTAYWSVRSVFKDDGRQSKRLRDIDCMVFNKVQRAADLWDPRCAFPDGTRFVFYLRNPVRVHLSRESYRQRHDPARQQWADTPENFRALLDEARQMFDACAQLRPRYPCLFLTHEHFCCAHDRVIPRLHAFLGLEPLPPGDPRAFFRHCGKCGSPFTTQSRDGQSWLVCPRHQRRVQGCGRFNPLRPIDAADVQSESWKSIPGIDRMQRELAARLGDRVADYYWTGRFAENLAENLAELPDLRPPLPRCA